MDVIGLCTGGGVGHDDPVGKSESVALSRSHLIGHRLEPATADIGHRQTHPVTANDEPYVACAWRPQPKASLLSVKKLSAPALLIGKHTSHYV